MIILELTEKEAELVQTLILAHSKLERNNEIEDFSDHERRLNRCKSISEIICLAFQPQKQEAIDLLDLAYIVSNAKDQYLALPADLHISNKKVEEKDFKHISLASAVIMWLNQKNLLKRLAAFDITDHSCQFEETTE